MSTLVRVQTVFPAGVSMRLNILEAMGKLVLAEVYLYDELILRNGKVRT